MNQEFNANDLRGPNNIGFQPIKEHKLKTARNFHGATEYISDYCNSRRKSVKNDER